MARHSSTERLGVIETDRIVTKFFGWIFREQQIIDVGMDALIEESVDGEPKGRFIAIQIKTGKGNFHVSEKHFTYYVSHIHYNYWLNLEIPIILVAHIPDTEKTYWEVISTDTFRKTKKKWKIDIPKNQEFNEKSKEKLSKLLSSKSQDNYVFDLYKGKIDPDNLFDFAEDTVCIRDSVSCVLNIADLIKEVGSKANTFKIRVNQFVQDGLSDKDAQVKACINGFGKDINICSRRLEHEIELFSELYSKGFYAYEQVILYHYLFTGDKEKLEIALSVVLTIPSKVDEAVQGINSMRIGVEKIPNKYAVLKEAKKMLIQILVIIREEFTQSKEMAIGLKDKIVQET